MIRLYLMARPKPNLDTRYDYRAHARGDCVEILEAHIHPGTSVVGNPIFRIVEVDAPLMVYAHLLETDINKSDGKRGVVGHLRKFTVDLDALEVGKNLSSEDVIRVTVDELNRLISQKPAVPDWRRIG